MLEVTPILAARLAVLAFIIGSLVFGAFAPRKTVGFAAPSLRMLVQALSKA